MAYPEKKHILIVDDEPGIIKFLKLKLEIAGFQVSISSGGQEALQMIDREVPDLMLLDIFMPGMDGFEVLAELRKTYQLPVIVLSARSSIAEQALSAGANDFISKPFSPEEVIKRVKASLNSSRTG
jgi:two-component system, OmpR family, response regulator VicR